MNNFKNEATRQGMSLSSISNLSQISRQFVTQDMLTDICNNPEGVFSGRIVQVCDTVGIDPAMIFSEMSENKYAYDGILKKTWSNTLNNVRKRIETIACEKSSRTTKCVNVARRVDNALHPIVIGLFGDAVSGKFTAAENLCGRKFPCAGSPATRKYSTVHIVSETQSRKYFDYPLDGYLYKIDSDVDVAMLMQHIDSDTIQNKFTPSFYDGMNLPDSNYIIFSDAPALNDFHMVCCNLNGDSDNRVDEALLISNTDIMIIMLSDNAAFLSRLTQLLFCAWEKWGHNMTDYIVLAVPKSDRYLTSDIQKDNISNISETKQKYSMLIEDCLSRIIDINTENGKMLAERLGTLIVPYSSIYKRITTSVTDASHNYEFDDALDQCIRKAEEEKSNQKQLIIAELRESVSNSSISDQGKKNMKNEINRIFNNTEKEFRRAFSLSYDLFMDNQIISELIKEHKLTRTQEDRQKALSLVNSRLTGLALKALDESIFKIFEDVRSINDSSCDDGIVERLSEIILKSINNMRVGSNDITQSLPKLSSKNTNNIPYATAGASLAASILPMAAILSPIAGAAGTVVSTYYAQTNFEKNTARKIVSSYSDNGVKDKLCEKIIASRIVPLRNELLMVLDGSYDDTDVQEYIGKVLKVLSE